MIKKGYYWIFLLAIGVLLISCKKDDEKAQENEENIMGTWLAVQRISEDCEDETMNGAVDLECTASECIRYHFYIEKVAHEDSTRDSVSVKTFVQEITFDNLTMNESGRYVVSESGISFCIDEEEVELCTTSDLKVSENGLEITSEDPDTGCRETLVFIREEE